MSQALKNLDSFTWGIAETVRREDRRIIRSMTTQLRWDLRRQKRREKKAREALKQPDLLLDDF